MIKVQKQSSEYLLPQFLVPVASPAEAWKCGGGKQLSLIRHRPLTTLAGVPRNVQLTSF